MKDITKYLLGDSGLDIDGDKIKTKHDCFIKTLNDYFGLGILCDHYEQVIYGEGNEREKINTVYSSSLQSLLIFSGVSKDTPIKVAGAKYTNVHFECKNQVIGTPSSIDVVLTNENGEALFIESKLYEIVRDSNLSGSAEIGPSYFSDNVNGYYTSLGLSLGDLERIGIEFPLVGYGEKKAGKIKAELEELRKNGNGNIGKDGKIVVHKLPQNDFVYSYGIKQVLSHIIGIKNFKNNKSESWRNEIKETAFITIINDLPSYLFEDARQKIEAYKKHVTEVANLFENKKTGIELLGIMTYQKLVEQNPAYFSGKEKLLKFYHLEKH